MNFPEYSQLRAVIFNFDLICDNNNIINSSIPNLFKALKNENILICAITKKAEGISEYIDISDYVDTVITTIIPYDKSIYRRSSVFLNAAKSLNVRPADCIVIESSKELICTALDDGFIVLGLGCSENVQHAHSCIETVNEISVDSLKALYTKYCPDLWTISQDGVCGEERESSIHTLFTTGNGRIGIRGSIPELPSGDSQGIYMAGFFDRMLRAPVDTSIWGEFYHYISYKELAEKERSEIYMVKCPDFLDMKWKIDEEDIDFSTGNLVSITRKLDMHQGVFTCRAHWISPSKKELVLIQKRFADMLEPNRVIVEYELELLNCSDMITVDAGIFTNTTNIGDTYIKTIYGKPDKEKLYNVISRERISEKSIGVLVEGKVDKLQAAFSTTLDVVSDTTQGYDISENYNFYAVRKKVFAIQNVPLRINRISSFALSRVEKSPYEAVKGLCIARENDSIMQIKASNAAFWRKYWESSDILLEGDAKTQLILRHSIYNLIIAASSDDPGVSIGAKALTGERYQGVVFWDTDIHMMPFYIFTQPHLAKNLVMYRYNMLEGARKKAASNGFKGAQFPWCSALSGDEECPKWLKWVTHQLHIVADVAYSVQNYVDCTLDESFYDNYGAELLIETARFWVSKAVTDGEAVSIPTAGGPDECHVVSNNSAYVNNLVRYNLELADRAIKGMKEKHPAKWNELSSRIGITEEEVDKIVSYKQAIKTMQKANGLYEQADGFFKLKDEIVDGEEPGKLPHLTQTVKQADVLMMLYLLNDLSSKDVLKTNWDYYEPRTIHSSSLSYGVHGILAAELGLMDRAESYLNQSLGIDLNDTQGNAGSGAHMAAHGMSWSSVIHGFAGARPVGDDFVITPRLPSTWKHLKFNLKWKNTDFIVDMAKDKICVFSKPESNKNLSLIINDEKYLVKPGDSVCKQL